MTWFFRIADINYKALGFSQGAENYLRTLNDWDRGTAVELSKITNEKGASRLEFHLYEYKYYLSTVQGKIPNRFLFPVFSWFFHGKIRLPEDLGRLTKALAVFVQQNNKFELKNIQQYPSLGDLEAAVSKVLGVNEESKRQVAKNIKMQGSREIYTDNEWRVLEMTTPEAVCELGKGTKWCTNADNGGFENAKEYLESGPLFLFLHNDGGKWQKYAQSTKSLDQVMDILDNQITKPSKSFINLLKKLIQLGFIQNNEFFDNYAKNAFYEGSDSDFADYFEKELKDSYDDFPDYAFRDILEYAKKFGRLKAVEDRIIFKPLVSDKKILRSYGITDGNRIEEYLDSVLKNGLRWSDKNHEAQIINSSYAFDYWKDRFSDYNYGEGKPGNGDYSKWPEYEASLLNNSSRSQEVADYLWYLNGTKRAEKRFEDYLLKSGQEQSSQEYSIEYAKNCNFRWPELERSILASEKLWDMYEYAKEVIKGRWIEAEEYLLNDKWKGFSEALYYVRDVLRQRWPEFEQKIIQNQNGWIASQYAVLIMKTRWQEMEPFILEDGDKSFAIYYKNNFGLSNKIAFTKTNWYKRAQEQKVYDLDDSYLDIGHSGFNQGKYGCNYIWVFYKSGEFKAIEETDLINNHGTWKNEGALERDYIYKGRVDSCKKIASMTPCDTCLDSAIKPMNGAREAFCERMKHICKSNIYQRFGNNIIIREF